MLWELSFTHPSPFSYRPQVDHREDHRCIVTRILDIPFAEGLHSRTGEVYPDDVDCLQFCHIIPDMTNMEIGGTAANEIGIFLILWQISR